MLRYPKPLLIQYPEASVSTWSYYNTQIPKIVLQYQKPLPSRYRKAFPLGEQNDIDDMNLCHTEFDPDIKEEDQQCMVI